MLFLHEQLEVVRNAEVNLLSVEQARLSLIHSNKFYHVCAQWQPALHQLRAAAVFAGYKKPDSVGTLYNSV